MPARLANLLLITSAVISSYLCVLAGEVVVPFFNRIYQPDSFAELRTLIPPETLFVCDHLPAVVGALVVVCSLALVAVRRAQGRVGQCVSVGLGAQWLVVWTLAFCLCYDGFLGNESMHHPRSFEFDQVIFLAGGIFPVSLVLILSTLILPFWSKRFIGSTRDKAAPLNPLVGEIRRRLEGNPFHPFTIIVNNGTNHRVSSRAHVSVAPRGTRVAIWSDRGVSSILATSNITKLEENPLDSRQTA